MSRICHWPPVCMDSAIKSLFVDERILLIEDDASVREAVDLLLVDAGFNVQSAADGEEALAKFAAGEFDLVVLDVMIPKIDGLDVCRMVRRDSNVPIVMLTARSTTTDLVLGLEIGADDYVVKPFEPDALIARIRALLRRVSGESMTPPSISVGSVSIMAEAHRVVKDGEEINVTAIEFKLLCELAQHRNQVLTRDALLRRVWGYEYAGDSRMVDMAVNRLRTKIEDNPSEPRLIRTVRGFGYSFEAP